ncbi:MAG: glycosyltransferase [Aggregatilineales bacterium]
MSKASPKCLIVTAELPYPPASGGSLRVWGLLRGLHAAGYGLTMICCQSGEVLPPLAQIARVVPLSVAPKGKTQRLRTLLTTQQPDIAIRLFDPHVLDTIAELLRAEDFDFVQFEGIETACYLTPLRAQFPAAKLVFDTFNAEAVMQRTIAQIDSQTPRRWLRAVYSYVQSQRIAAYERQLCHHADLVIAVSDEDQAHLAAHGASTPLEVVPSGITVSEYAPPSGAREDGLLVFTGKMDYRPNIDAVEWLVREVLPHIPQARLQVVGQQPTDRVRALASERVEITGRVPQVQPYLQAAAVYVAPLRMGSGTRLKLLEAMACGCAIVATPLAASGLSHGVERVMRIADTAERFAAAVRSLLEQPRERAALGSAARDYVQQHYDWSAITPRMVAAHQRMLHG